VDSFSILPLSSPGPNIERVRLYCAFQAPTLRQAAALAAELKTIAACAPRVRSVAAPPSDRRDWIVTATTPPIPLTLTVLRGCEEELLAIERRWSGCRFLGWRTDGKPLVRPHVPDGSLEADGRGEARSPGAGDPADIDESTSQRRLVVASLLRHPPGGHEHDAPRGASRR
jgi:hypothetical protein